MKDDTVLGNLPLGEEKKSELPPAATSSVGQASILTSAPTLDSLMPTVVKPFDPLGESSIPSLGQRKAKRRARPRMKNSADRQPGTDNPLSKVKAVNFSKSNKVIGDVSDSEEENDNFKKELKQRAGKDESVVISDSPKSTHHDSEMKTEGSTKAMDSVVGDKKPENSNISFFSLLNKMNEADEKVKETPVEPIEKKESPKPITEKDFPSSSPLMPQIDFDTEKLQKILNIDDIRSTTIIKFHCEKLRDAELLYEASKLKFPPIKKLELINMDDLIIDEDIQGANDMLGKAITTPMKYLYLGGGSHGDLNRFADGLENILKLVSQQIFISGFTIDANTLRTIFEQGAKCDYIVLDDCKIKLDKKFTLDTNINFDVRQLDLYRTCRKEEKEYLDLFSFPKFIDELSKTSLRASLGSVHVKESAYPAKEVQMIFDNAKFNVTVTGDEYRMDSLEA